MASTNVSVHYTSINGHTVPLFSQNEDAFPVSAANTDWLLVKFDQFITYPLKEAFRQDQKLEIYERIDEHNVYLCRYMPDDLNSIINDNRTTHLSLYPNSAVPVAGLMGDSALDNTATVGNLNGTANQNQNGRSESNGEQPIFGTTVTQAGDEAKISVVVALHPNPTQTPQQVLQQLEADFAVEHLDSEIQSESNLVRVRLGRDQIPSVAEIDSIRAIDEIQLIEPHSIIADEVIGTNPPTQSFRWTGAGQTVHVADSGFDTGSSTNVHPAFTGRVLAATTATGATNPFDESGHGTHVAGSVLGNLSQGAANDVTNIKGTAPEASLVSLALNFSALPPLLGLFTQVVNGLPKPIIHTNSWGPHLPPPPAPAPTQISYSAANAEIVDKAMSQDSKLCILFSAGNSGRILTAPTGRQQQIGSYAAAKNSIVVGASYSIRPVDSSDRYDLSGTVHQAQEMTKFSSRGPTVEGRLGVDVVAPGCVVLSARSRSILPANLTKSLKNYGVPIMPNLLYSRGTSMSTPAVAGCVACLRQVYKATYGTDPTGAMLKALIIHGAIDLVGTKFTNETSAGSTTLTMTAAPNTFQGYGLVNIQNSIAPLVSPATGTNGTQDGAAGTGSTIVGTLTIPARVSRLVVTLAYTDLPGSGLQNIIKLQILSSGRLWASPLQSTDPLSQTPPIVFASNNIAKIVVPNPAAGTYQIVLDIMTGNATTPYAVTWSAS